MSRNNNNRRRLPPTILENHYDKSEKFLMACSSSSSTHCRSNPPQQIINKCISFFSPDAIQKTYRLIEHCEMSGILKSGPQRDKNVFIYTSPKNIPVANQIKDAFSKMISPNQPLMTTSSASSTTRGKPSIIIDTVKDYANPYYFHSFVSQVPSVDTLIIVITDQIEEVERILESIRETQSVENIFTSGGCGIGMGATSTSTSTSSSPLLGFLHHPQHHRHRHQELTPQNTKCKIASLNIRYLSPSQEKVYEVFTIREELSHSKKLHESPLFPF
jgi:hypothetical protein